MRFIILYLLLVKLNLAVGQSKKEQIAILMIERDSVINLLQSANNKNDSLNEKYIDLNKNQQKLIKKNNHEISELKLQVSKLNSIVDSLKNANQLGKIDLQVLKSTKNCYKTYKSISDDKFTLIIFKDSISTHDEKRIITEISLNESPLFFIEDSFGNLIAEGWGGLSFIDSKTIKLSINCTNVLLQEIDDGLTWNRSYVYREDSVRVSDYFPYFQDSDGKSYLVYQDYTFTYFNKPELKFLNKITDELKNTISSEVYQVEWGGDQLIYYSKDFISIERNTDDATFDGGHTAPGLTTYYSYDIKNQKLLNINDIFAPYNMDRLKQFLKKEIIKVESRLIQYEIEDEFYFAVKEKGMVFNFDTRWALEWSYGYTNVYVPYSTLEKFMLDNDVTKKLLNKY
jgi:hypothetical protein